MQQQSQLKPIQAGRTAECPDAGSHQTLLNSLNFRCMNPDVLRHPYRVNCICGRELNIVKDWYTEAYDGTLVCWLCSSCSRCGMDCSVGNRKLVSIGGYVLCYRCIRFYGDPTSATGIIRVKSSKKASKKRSKKKAIAGSHNSAGDPQLQEAQRKDSNDRNAYNGANRWQVTESPENRSLIRVRKYPRPERFYEPATDPKVKPQTYYTATQPQFECMACPSCGTAAHGKVSYIVPSISMVYHRTCFRCTACRSIMSTGISMAGFHYVHCTCDPPLQWCTRVSCTKSRMEHHSAMKCKLEPVHPGGRPQMDTRLLAADPAKSGAKNEPRDSFGSSGRSSSVSNLLGPDTS